MKYFLRIVIAIAFVVVSKFTFANHGAGCDIQFSYQNKDSVEVLVSMYRDCKGISLGAITLDIAGIGCSYSASYTLQQISCGDITQVCKKSCSKCDRSSCNSYGYPNGSNAGCNFPYGMEKIVFRKMVDLTGTNCCKIRFAVNQCCRSTALTTCCSGDNLYNYAEIDRCTAPQNTSLQFGDDFTQMICAGNCTAINLGGIDTVDHDSISYHLSGALSAYGTSCTYNGSYTYMSPLYYDSFPKIYKYNPLNCKGFSLDVNTGILNFKPKQQQTVVIAMDIKEWRKDTNGTMVQVALTRRDLQLIIVANCTNRSPSLQTAATVTGCAGDMICFKGIKSSDPDSKDTVMLKYFGDLHGAVFTPKFNNSKKQEFDLCWQTDSTDASKTPYFFTVTATDNACPLAGIYTKSFNIKVGSRKPVVTRKITHIGCGKVKLEVPATNATAQDSFTYVWMVNGVWRNGKTATANINYDSTGVIMLTVNNGGCIAVFYDTIYIPARLKLDLGADTVLCRASSLTLHAKAKNGFPPYQYQWQTGNAGDTLDTYTKNIYATSACICKVTDSVGCQTYDTILVQIYNNTFVNAGPDQAKCLGDTIAFAITGVYTSYKWIDASNNIVSNNRYLYTTQKGNYIIQVVDSIGCIQSDSVSAGFYIPKQVNVSDQRKCNNEVITFDAGSGFKQYTWIDYNSQQMFGNTQTYAFTSPQKFMITTADSNNCITSDTAAALFNPAIVISHTYPKIICKYDTIQLQAWGAGYIEWRDIADTTLLYTGDTVYHSFDKNTKFVLKGYTTSNQVTCQAMDTIDIHVLQIPQVFVPSQYIVCHGEYALISISASAQKYYYKWSTGDTTSYIQVSTPGLYTLTATDSLGCKSISTTHLTNYPLPNLSISFLNDTLYSSYTNSQLYTWNRDNVFDVITMTPSFYVKQIGDYKVIIKDSNGCYDTSATLKVTTLKSSIAEAKSFDGVKIYPNPSTGIYYIETNQSITDLNIYDMMGRKVYNISADKNIIDLSSQPEGIYLLQVNKNIWIKVIKY